MVKILIILTSVLALSGCASKCTSHCVFGFGPGSDAFTAVAKHYDDRDPCQSADKPSFCGASSGKIVRITKSSGNSYIVQK